MPVCTARACRACRSPRIWCRASFTHCASDAPRLLLDPLSDAGAHRCSLDIVFDLCVAIDFTYLIDHAGEIIPAVTDDAAQYHLAGNNCNLDTGTDVPFRPNGL